MTEDLAGRPDFGKDSPRHVEHGEKLVVPVQGVDVEQHRPAGICDVRGVDQLVRKVPYQPGVDRPAGELAALCPALAVWHFVQEPPDLGAREVGVYRQPRLPPHCGLVAARLQLIAQLRRPPALPHDGVRYRLPRPAVPHDESLALVRNAYANDRPRMRLKRLQQLLDNLQARLEQLHRIVFHPPRTRVHLPDLPAHRPQRRPRSVDQHASRPRRPLVQRDNIPRLASYQPLILCHHYKNGLDSPVGAGFKPAFPFVPLRALRGQCPPCLTLSAYSTPRPGDQPLKHVF